MSNVMIWLSITFLDSIFALFPDHIYMNWVQELSKSGDFLNLKHNWDIAVFQAFNPYPNHKPLQDSYSAVGNEWHPCPRNWQTIPNIWLYLPGFGLQTLWRHGIWPRWDRLKMKSGWLAKQKMRDFSFWIFFKDFVLVSMISWV